MNIQTFLLYAVLFFVNISALVFFLKDDRKRHFGKFVHWSFVGFLFLPTTVFYFPLICSPLSLFVICGVVLVGYWGFIMFDEFFLEYDLYGMLLSLLFVASILNLKAVG